MEREEEKFVAIVEMGIEILVDLPEGIDWDNMEGDELPEEIRERVLDAAFAALPERCGIYLDGEDKPPTKVIVYAEDHNVEDIRIEPE